jgi:hypothetical protein
MLCSISISTLIISVNNRYEIAITEHRERKRERQNAGTDANVKRVTKVQFISYTAIRFA